MSDKPFSLWEKLRYSFEYYLAVAAMRWCGPELLYWIDPVRWEEYIAEGVPFVEEDWGDEE